MVPRGSAPSEELPQAPRSLQSGCASSFSSHLQHLGLRLLRLLQERTRPLAEPNEVASATSSHRPAVCWLSGTGEQCPPRRGDRRRVGVQRQLTQPSWPSTIVAGAIVTSSAPSAPTGWKLRRVRRKQALGAPSPMYLREIDINGCRVHCGCASLQETGAGQLAMPARWCNSGDRDA